MNPAVLSGQTSYLVTFIASFLIWFMFGAFLALWLIRKKLKSRQALHVLFAVLLAWVLSQVMKILFPSLRPFEATNTAPLTLTIPFDGAYPSSHAAVSFGLATSVWMHDKKFGFLFLLSALVVSLGRVLSNVHYFSDIAAGGILGISASYILKKTSFS